MPAPNDIIVKNLDVLGGAAVFRGTRVPFQALLDYIEGGQTLDEFLDDFPTVTRAAAISALELAKSLVVGSAWMKILIDECIPRKFKNGFSAHDCHTVPEAELAGKRNGELLSLAEQRGFQIFLTMDKGIEFEQNLAGRAIAILILAPNPTALRISYRLRRPASR